MERASVLGEQSLALYRQIGDKRGIGDALTALGSIAHRGGDRPRALQLLEAGLALYREIGSEWDIAYGLLHLADTQMRYGDPARAAASWAECLGIFRRLGDEWGIGFALGGSGELARYQGNYPRATELFLEALVLHRKRNNWMDIPYCLEALALVAIALKASRSAAHLWGRADALRQQLNAPVPLSYQSDYAPLLSQARTDLGKEEFEQAWAEGRALTLDQAIAEAKLLAQRQAVQFVPEARSPQHPDAFPCTSEDDPS